MGAVIKLDRRIIMLDPVDLPTRFGHFRLFGFDDGGQEHVAVVRGNVAGESEVPMRIHSECLTGDALGSLRCDCREQLEASLSAIGAMERGIVLYLRQEGRGIGLLNKLRAYKLQEQGLDTVEANRALGFPDDARDYRVAASMLRELDVTSVAVMTNNPNKVAQLEAHGVPVTRRIPHEMPPNPHNCRYLATKAARSGHLLTLVGAAAK